MLHISEVSVFCLVTNKRTVTTHAALQTK